MYREFIHTLITILHLDQIIKARLKSTGQQYKFTKLQN